MGNNNQSPTPGTWKELSEGSAVEITKLYPDGSTAATYPATVLRSSQSWIEVVARWTFGSVESEGLHFRNGDLLVEYFSPECMFNAFQVFGKSGKLKGWYANVTYPAWITVKQGSPSLTWHDLFVDLIMLADGNVTVADEDELNDSGLVDDDPDLITAIEAARDEMVRRAMNRTYPFHARDDLATIQQALMIDLAGGISA